MWRKEKTRVQQEKTFFRMLRSFKAQTAVLNSIKSSKIRVTSVIITLTSVKAYFTELFSIYTAKLELNLHFNFGGLVCETLKCFGDGSKRYFFY